MKTPLQRKIVDYKKLTEGYTDSDIITFPNSKGEIIEAVEVCSEDTKYLVKVSKRLANSMQEYEENLEEVLPEDEDFED